MDGKGSEPRYLIGPAMYPTFLQVVFGAVTVPAAIAIAVRLVEWLAADRPIDIGALPFAIWSYADYVAGAIGVVVVIFAAIERVGVFDRSGDRTPSRDAHLQPPLPQALAGGRVSSADVTTSLWGILIMLAVLNWYPHVLALPLRFDQSWIVVPLTAIGITWPTALYSTFLTVALLFHLMLVRAGRWTRPFRWTQVGVGMFGLMVTIALVRGLHEPATGASWLAAQGLSQQQHERAFEAILVIHRILEAVLWVSLACQVGTAAARIWRLMPRRGSVRHAVHTGPA